MLGRAGRPDYHDRGIVWLLVEPNGVYHASHEMTEDEVAFRLLNDETEDVDVAYTPETAAEETLANLAVAGRGAKRLNDRMVGRIDTTQALGVLIEAGLIDGPEPTQTGRVVTEHFLSLAQARLLRNLIKQRVSPPALVAAIDTRDEDED